MRKFALVSGTLLIISLLIGASLFSSEGPKPLDALSAFNPSGLLVSPGMLLAEPADAI